MNMKSSVSTAPLTGEEENGENNENKKLSDFDTLPFRTIIYDILSFYEFKILKRDRRKINTFSLFGSFKRDPFHRIWFLFTSLTILDHQSNVIISPHQIQNLIFYYNPQQNPTRTPASNNVMTVRRFHVLYSTLFQEEPNPIWNSENSILTSLRNFHFVCPPLFRERRIPINKYPISRLTSLRLFDWNLTKEEFSHFNPNLERILLERVSLLPSYEIIHLVLPQLKSLDIRNCSNNIFIKTGPSLRKLSLFESSPQICDFILQHSPNLQSIHFQPSNRDGMVYLNTLKNKSLTKLRNLQFGRLEWTEEFTNSTFSSVYSSLEELKVDHCSNFDISVLSKLRGSKLKKLTLSKCVNETFQKSDLEWSFSDQLTSFKIIRTGSVTMTPVLILRAPPPSIFLPIERIFTQNSFFSLRSLEIRVVNRDFKFPSSENWFPFPSLKRFTIEIPRHFHKDQNLDQLFERDFFFPCLEELCILHTSLTLKNAKQSNFLRLKKLTLYRSIVEEFFFINVQLIRLEELILIASRNVSGYKWKLMRKLKKLRVEEMEGFGRMSTCPARRLDVLRLLGVDVRVKLYSEPEFVEFGDCRLRISDM